MKKPSKKNVTPSFYKYLDLAPDDDLLSGLKKVKDSTIKELNGIPQELEEYQYDVDKWNVKQVVCHLISSERYFCDLVVRLTKEDAKETIVYPYVKYDLKENAKRSLEDLIEDYKQNREATIQFYKNFDADLATKVQTINGNVYTPVGVGFIILGHEIHHLSILKEKYLAPHK